MNLFCQLTTDFYLGTSFSWMLLQVHQIDAGSSAAGQQLVVNLYEVREDFMIPWVARKASELGVALGKST